VTTRLNETHRADLVSWVESANDAATDFPIQNLPLGMFRAPGRDTRPCAAVGDRVLDLVALRDAGLLNSENAELVEACVQAGALNPLLEAGRDAMSRLRGTLSALLRADTPEGKRARERSNDLLVRTNDVKLLLPAHVGDYSDFYASIHHATNVGSMFRPDNPLLPNYKWVPIGYHGRASSIVPSGTPVIRPAGQTRDGEAAVPAFGPSRRLDYEMEVGAYIGVGNVLGKPIPIAKAESHVAGLCLVNDWSARDLQTWEYQPLGPFLAKNFATTVSPWIVTLEALEPFRFPAFTRAPEDPEPLPHLRDARNQREGGFDITLDVLLRTRRMREADLPAVRVSRGSFTSMYWTVAQLVAHHASNGCNLRPGDLLASGTVSGPTKESRGCLLERTWKGTEPLELPSGETRRFLEDGDEVIMRGWCDRAGARRIGFGEAVGAITSAPAPLPPGTSSAPS
jgi:fumarylacetoacetase